MQEIETQSNYLNQLLGWGEIPKRPFMTTPEGPFIPRTSNLETLDQISRGLISDGSQAAQLLQFQATVELFRRLKV